MSNFDTQYQRNLNNSQRQSRRSVQRMVRCAFTPAEAEHIWWLIKTNEMAGWYCGKKEQYWKRSERIKAKLANDRAKP